MEKDLNNKTVLITGGAQGIGCAIVEKYLDKGVRTIIVIDFDEKQGKSSVEKLNAKYGNNKVEFYKGDVTTDLEALSAQILKKHPQVDVLINNAGIVNEYKPRETINTNVTALIEWSMKFFEHMRKDKGGVGGTIINLASIYGFRIDPFLPVYRASKFAVMGFTKSFGHPFRYEKYGVRVVAICPGFTDTTLTDNVAANDDPTVQKGFEEMLAKTDWQKVDSVGNAAVEVFEKAESGTAWLIEGGKPIVSV